MVKLSYVCVVCHSMLLLKMWWVQTYCHLDVCLWIIPRIYLSGVVVFYSIADKSSRWWNRKHRYRKKKKINKAFGCQINARGEILPSFIVLSRFVSLSISCGQWEGCSKMILRNFLSYRVYMWREKAAVETASMNKKYVELKQ